MKNLENVLRVRQMLARQTAMLAQLVDPKRAIARAEPPSSQELALAALDGIGLLLTTMRVLLDEFIALAHPEIFEKDKKETPQ